MADPIVKPPHAELTAPQPLPSTVALNPPMVGTASPFERVDGQNRDLILEAIRAWARGPLMQWSKSWDSTLIGWLGSADQWLDEWSDETERYVEEAMAEQQEAVNAIVQAIINSSVTVQDPVVAGILDDLGSVTRPILNAIIDSRVPGEVLSRMVTHVTTDMTATIQGAIDSLSDGSTLIVDNYTWRVDGTLTIPHDDFTLHIMGGAIIDRSADPSPNTSGIIFTGARPRVTGSGRILSPAVWNGTNVEWTNAVLLFNGCEDPVVEGVTLYNVPRVGVGFNEVRGTATVTGARIIANYPPEQWTEVETANFGVGFDPFDGAMLKVQGNVIQGSVQGVCFGNFGQGYSPASDISDNTFIGCHNHAVYNSGGADCINVVGNTMLDCSRPIALSGSRHVVMGNNMHATGTGGNLHKVCSIHIRNAVGCIVEGNRMSGDGFTDVPAIALTPTGVYDTTFRNNIVRGNIINISDTFSAPGITVGGSDIIVNGLIISDNIITGRGRLNQGLVNVITKAGEVNDNVKIHDNVIRIRGQAHGIFATNLTNADIAGNSITLEFSAAVAVVLGAIFLNTGSGAKVRNNRIKVPSGYGTNVTFRGLYESNTVDSELVRNTFDVSLVALAAWVPYSNSPSSRIDGMHPGAPTVVCAPGSVWVRTDGGAGSTLYIKETPNNSNVWRAV